MRVGYVRVSKHEQNEELQMDALHSAGCEKLFTDKISGSKFERKGLDETFAVLRPGDTFICTSSIIAKPTKCLSTMPSSFLKLHIETDELAASPKT
jgi:hypothetical protein